MAAREEGRARIFAGVDEAGLGPLLGPMTIGFSAFRAPSGATNLWKTLSKVVTSHPAKDRGRFVVADSKVVFTRNPRGEKRLERTALGFLALLDPERRPPRDARRLVWDLPGELACPSAGPRHPWYAELPRRLPRHQEAGSLELAIERLAREMSAREVELLDAGVRVVPEAELNRSFARTCNKSVTVWQVTEPILRRVWERFGAQGVHMVADRQGGRFHYHPLLEAAFPEATVELVRERPSLSEYTLSGRGRDPRRMRLAFAERAERRSFAVALGSCIAKYARETCMAAFNAYFAGFDPDLKPTAGYRNDGWRWLEDASEIVARIDRKMLVRER